MAKETFGEVIKNARMSKALSLRELAKRIGISHPYLSQLENNHNDNPSIDIIFKLSDALDISFAYLIHLSKVEIGLKKELPDNVVEMLSILKQSDFDNIDTFEDFKNTWIEKGNINVSDIEDDLAAQLSDNKLRNFYKNILKLKQIEANMKNNARLQQMLNEDENPKLKKSPAQRFGEYIAVENYNDDSPTAIFLDENNEGNFYFFKDGGILPEDIQEKLRLMIKTILD